MADLTLDRTLPADPRTGPEAFADADDASAMSQAAILLLSSRMLRADPRVVASSQLRAVREPMINDYDAEDLGRFPLAPLAPDPGRLMPRQLRAASRRLSGLLGIAEVLYREPSLLSAAALMYASMTSPHELTRTAAAASYFWHGTEPRKCILQLRKALTSDSLLVRELAATALARISPGDPGLRRLLRPKPVPASGLASQTAVIVHGTWAQDAAWWQPAGDYHEYLQDLRGDVYGAADRYRWKGDYDHAVRVDAARKLEIWVRGKGFEHADLLGHSYGANVMLLATQYGMTAGKLVLLSCPVHENVYYPDFARIRDGVFAIRVRMDLVVIADGGGLKFRNKDIQDIRLGVWFNHGASHDPEVWRRDDIPSKVGM